MRLIKKAGEGLGWTKVIIPITSFSRPSTSSTIDFYLPKPNEVIHATFIDPMGGSGGGAIASLTASIGDLGNLLKYSSAINIFTGATTPQPEARIGMEGTGAATAVSLKITVTSTGANLTDLSKGTISVYILTSILP